VCEKIEIVGMVEINPYGDWSDVDKGTYVNYENILPIIDKFNGRRIKITIEELPEENTDEELTVNIPLRKIVGNNDAVEHFGLNPYCINEGADGDEKYKIPISLAKEWGFV
jgi:hypothetical protein